MGTPAMPKIRRKRVAVQSSSESQSLVLLQQQVSFRSAPADAALVGRGTYICLHEVLACGYLQSLQLHFCFSAISGWMRLKVFISSALCTMYAALCLLIDALTCKQELVVPKQCWFHKRFIASKTAANDC
jgi:hypothetical protein